MSTENSGFAKAQIEGFEAWMQHTATFTQAVNAFLQEKFPNEIHPFGGVVDWHQAMLRKVKEAHELNRQIQSLTEKGYSVTKAK